MFLVIQNDTINLKDISRISRKGSVITVYFMSSNEPATYNYDNDSDATEVEFKVFKNLEEKGLVV